MTEILDLANSIAETKENIRTAIVARGIECGTDVPFANYPGKIGQIARDPAIWARNDLGKNPVEGEKVLLQKLEQTAGLEANFYTTSQIEGRGGMRLLPYTATRFAVLNASTANRKVVSWTEEGGFETVYTPSGGFNSFYADRYNYIFYTPYICWICDWSSFQSNQNILLMPDQQLTPESNTIYLANGCLYDQSSRNVYEYDATTGAAGELVGTFESEPATNAPAKMCPLVDGEYIIIFNSGKYYVYQNNSGVFQQTKEVQMSLFSEGEGFFLGTTADNQYIILNTWKNSACYPRLLKIAADMTITEDTSLALSGVPAYYPWLETLITNDAGTIRMFKYAAGVWMEKNVDFEETFAQSAQVTINNDASKMFVNDCTAFDAGSARLYNLTSTAGGYKAMPATPLNYNTAAITGFATGDVNAGDQTIEVNALLPASQSSGGSVTVSSQ